MSTLQLKNVPESMKRSLRKRARSKGLSMSQYVVGLIRADLSRPDERVLAERLNRLRPVHSTSSAAELLAEARSERESGR